MNIVSALRLWTAIQIEIKPVHKVGADEYCARVLVTAGQIKI
jgi:hypothetical protein